MSEELKKTLYKLMGLPAETEWLEFKEAKTNYDFNKLGRYFSALSNEANLKSKECGWLIFGVKNQPREIIGTHFRLNRANLDSLKAEVAQKTTNRITFIEIYEIFLSEGRIIMFKIPAAPKGIPVAWEGHYYGRDGESLVPLNIQEIEYIRNQLKQLDWSAQICKNATIDDLDPKAIERARIEFKKKNPKLNDEVNQWNDVTFLNKSRITIQDKITRAAIILLGKEESEHFISPSIAKISWILKDEHGIEKDYQHYGPPFLLKSDELYVKIRNLKYRYLPDNSLFPTEVTQYEPYLIRETLHNCIAHQDYELKGRINIIEQPDELIFTNAGSFLPGSVENVIIMDAPPERYRNQFLVNAMVNFNMIDSIGSGIKKMFLLQRSRCFPMPSYDLQEQDRVKVSILGRIMDENYTRLLMNHADLDLKTVISLDKVQKGLPLFPEEINLLKAQKLIEGRKPNYFVAAKIASITGDKSSYIKNRAFNDQHYKKLIIAFIEKYGSACRKDIDDLLLDKLSDALDEKQKLNKIRNLLYAMSKRDKSIKNSGSDHKPVWVLLK